MSISRRRATLGTLLGSCANTLIVSIQAILLIPLYLNAIGPRLYGAWLGSGDILVWMQAFDLGLPNLMIQRIGGAHGRGDVKSTGEYFACGMVMMAGMALTIGMIAFLVSFRLPEWMGLRGEEGRILQSCFVVGATGSAINIFNNSIVGFSRGIQNTAFMNAVVIISSLVSFAVSLSLVLTGWGLWAIALGLVARAGAALSGSLLFLARILRGELLRHFRIRRQVLREFLIISPATTIGGIGYAIMNQSEAAIVAIFIRPELATVLTLTRKALEVARGLVDAIAFATYGSFAHLLTSEQRYRSLHIHAEITSLQLSLAIAMVSAYMAVNASLVSVWVGISQYGGSLLTILLGVQFIVVGVSFLLNYLYRGTGQVMRGSIALAIEGAIRVPLMIGLLFWAGLAGIPIAGIITGSIFGLLAYRWTIKEISEFASQRPNRARTVWIMRAGIFSVGIFVNIFVLRESWTFVLVVGLLVAILGGAVLICIDPMLKNIRVPLFSVLNRLQKADFGTRG